MWLGLATKVSLPSPLLAAEFNARATSRPNPAVKPCALAGVVPTLSDDAWRWVPILIARRSRGVVVTASDELDGASQGMTTLVGALVSSGLRLWALEVNAQGNLSGAPDCGSPKKAGRSPELVEGFSRPPTAKSSSLRAREYGYSNVGFKSRLSFIDLKNLASRAVTERLSASYERTAMLFGSESWIFRHPPPE